ncbi:aspartyl-tRNA amidotransferase subunit B [Bacteroidia bacterium]|nr:aspartyl-tRNA amidotransferase subunit B [Bacteroidia bacterium]
MALETQINADIKTAMLAKNAAKLEALRAVKAAILLEKTKGANSDLTTEVEMKLLQKLVKQRRESADIYAQNSRPELADKETVEANFIEEYLPKQMSNDEIADEVKKIIAQVGAASIKDLGKVMGVASKFFAGKADGKVVAETVKSLLS